MFTVQPKNFSSIEKFCIAISAWYSVPYSQLRLIWFAGLVSSCFSFVHCSGMDRTGKSMCFITMVPSRYGFSFGDQGDEFIGWGGFATKGDMFDVNQSYHLAHMFYNFCLLNLVPTISSGKTCLEYVPWINTGLHGNMLTVATTVLLHNYFLGSLSERTNVVAYFVLTLFISTLVTPIQMHWIWSKDGWASYQTRYLLDTGALDYAGMLSFHPLF